MPPAWNALICIQLVASFLGILRCGNTLLSQQFTQKKTGREPFVSTPSTLLEASQGWIKEEVEVHTPPSLR